MGKNDDGFNLAADLHQDGRIDAADVMAFDSREFEIGQGLSGAWFYPVTAGQGLFLDVFERDGATEVVAAWFTFDLSQPSADDGESFGAPEQRWFTAQGQATDNTANLSLFVSSGGVFDDPATVTTESTGSLTISFSSCTEGNVSYRFDGTELTGSFPIQRITPSTDCQ